MIDERGLRRGLRFLAARDADLARVYAALGAPPLWRREPGFPALVRIILEQQVSLASARAAFERLLAAAGRLTPESFLEFDDAALKRIGFSRQKAHYCRLLAREVIAGRFDFAALDGMSDEGAREALRGLKGVGAWTAEIYLLMALGRRDAWPAGDLALAEAARGVKGLAARPTALELEALSLPWRPWRAAAARLLWHYYLSP